MYIYIIHIRHTHTYIYIYLCTCTCTYTYTYTRAHTHIYITCTWLHMYMYKYMQHCNDMIWNFYAHLQSIFICISTVYVYHVWIMDHGSVCMYACPVFIYHEIWCVSGWMGGLEDRYLHTFAELHSRPRRCSTASVPRSWQIRSLLAVLLAFLQNLLRISSHFPSNCKLHTLTETDATQCLPKIVHATSTSSSFVFFLCVCVF